MTSVNVDNTFTFIDFNDILEKITRLFINNLYDYYLIIDNKINLKNIDVKKFLYHEVIHEICESIINNKKIGLKQVFIITNLKPHNDIYDFCSGKDYNALILKILKQIKNKLPVLIFFTEKTIDFELFHDKYFCKKGKGKEALLLIYNLCSSLDNKSYSFLKIKNFSKKYGLVFLTNKYFNQLKVKQFMY